MAMAMFQWLARKWEKGSETEKQKARHSAGCLEWARIGELISDSLRHGPWPGYTGIPSQKVLPQPQPQL